MGPILATRFGVRYRNAATRSVLRVHRFEAEVAEGSWEPASVFVPHGT